ncbi:hypothetical protein M5K25_018077 [Dendrobium thyrsiflorum]|uniref:Uncharacterized protein n=1 Tax=Dendrobium thyrsiflorum TaxID=117978 RepID=A0ABD0UP36_DENTH
MVGFKIKVARVFVRQGRSDGELWLDRLLRQEVEVEVFTATCFLQLPQLSPRSVEYLVFGRSIIRLSTSSSGINLGDKFQSSVKDIVPPFYPFASYFDGLDEEVDVGDLKPLGLYKVDGEKSSVQILLHNGFIDDNILLAQL